MIPPAQSSIDWLAHALDSKPNTTANNFGTKAEHTLLYVASKAARVVTEGTVTPSKGGHMVSKGDHSPNKGDSDCGTECINPVLGKTVSPIT
jgi:hypothetical protein